MAAGNRHLRYKDALNDIEAASPGAKFDFFHGFLARAAHSFQADEQEHALGTCTRCGAPASTDICAFCRLVERATTDGDGGAGPRPVQLGRTRRSA